MFFFSLAIFAVVVLICVDASHLTVIVIVSSARLAYLDELFWFEAEVMGGVVSTDIAEEIEFAHFVLRVISKV
jgi:hypothetical protein